MVGRFEWSSPGISVGPPPISPVHLNDLPQWIESSITLFVDDTKVWRVIKTDDDQKALQSDLDRLMEWSDKWLLKFNQEKCKVIYIGENLKKEYWMRNEAGSHSLTGTIKERDLGIIVRSDLKPSAQCSAAATRGMSVMRLVRRNFRNLDAKSFLILYKTYIRPNFFAC